MPPAAASAGGGMGGRPRLLADLAVSVMANLGLYSSPTPRLEHAAILGWDAAILCFLVPIFEKSRECGIARRAQNQIPLNIRQVVELASQCLPLLPAG